ncbi:HTH_Tnp_Tc3_2 domain-containing protein [Trichonephila clavipes]|nr:HTH_Tnp_Tc3_2 domain-containing protein [Trichonephila clavipes]
MDITPKKRSEIIVLNEHSSMTVRDIDTVVVCVWCGKIKCFKNFKNISRFMIIVSKKKEKCRLKRKITLRTHKILIRNSKINEIKTSTDLRRDLFDYGVEVITSTVQKRVMEVSREASRSRKKQFLTQKMMEIFFSICQKYRSWPVNDKKKVILSEETHLIVQGMKIKCSVRRSENEALLPDHIQQTVKHPSKQMFWVFLHNK